MKVLMITRLHNGEGPTSVLKAIGPFLRKEGIQIDFLCVDEINPPRDEVFSDVKVLTKAECFRRLFNKDFYSYDLYHFHGAFLYQFLPIASELRRHNKKYIITAHGNLMRNALDFHAIRKRIYLIFLARKYFGGASLIHALSSTEADDIKKVFPNTKIHVIPNGVNNDDFKRGTLNQNKIVFTFLGRIDVQHKGIDLLLMAFDHALKLCDKNIKLYLYGPFNTSKDQSIVSQIISTSNLLQKNVDIMGPVYDDAKYQAIITSDVFVHTSRYEGMPMAVLEAMDMAVPVLITDETNMGDIVRSSGCGEVVNLDIDSITEGIIKMSNLTREERMNKGIAGRESAMDHLSWKTIAMKYYEMYEMASLGD